VKICQQIPIRFGNWNNGDNAGVAALNLNNGRKIANKNIGFRLDFEYARRLPLKGGVQCGFIGRLCPSREGK